MSLVVVCFIPTGIILSGDSRSTNTYKTIFNNSDNPDEIEEYTNSFVASDYEKKVFLSFGRFGIAVCGTGLIDGFPIQYHIENFESKYNSENKIVKDFAFALKDYFRVFQPVPFLFFFVGAYENNEQFVYRISVAEDEIVRINFDETHDVIDYSVDYEGMTDVVERLLTHIPSSYTLFKNFNLQDGIDYTRHLIITSINQLKFESQFPTIGGEIETLVVTRNSAEFIYQKKLRVKDI